MKYQVIYSKRFTRQYKKLSRSGDRKTLQALDLVIDKLVEGKNLLPQNHNHRLVGNLQEFFEYHVLPDWLLIYRIDDDIMILELMATCTHSNLFK